MAAKPQTIDSRCRGETDDFPLDCRRSAAGSLQPAAIGVYPDFDEPLVPK